MFAQSELANRLSKVFWDHDLNLQLTGFLSRMIGRTYNVDEIVLIEELTYRRKAEFDNLLKNLEKKISRKRTLVFLDDSFLHENPENLLSQTGFQKLEGTHFYISGSIDKIKEKSGLKFGLFMTNTQQVERTYHS